MASGEARHCLAALLAQRRMTSNGSREVFFR